MVLVTGGVRGVGAGISAVFAEQGATVITCARREVEGLPYEFHACDVRDDAAVKAMIDAIVAKHGRLDVVVNNAGGSPFALAADASAKFSTKIIELNLIAPLLVSTHANAVMQQQDTGGVIVNISSVSAHRPSPGTGAYGAAKAGIDNMMRNLALEWGRFGIRCNSIAPGPIEGTEGVRRLVPEGSTDALKRMIPLGRFGTPDDIGQLSVFLASPLASYITGTLVVADGGQNLPGSGAWTQLILAEMAKAR